MKQQSNGIKAFATRSPFLFALVFFVVSFCLVLVDLFVLPPLWGDQIVQSLLAFGVLVWLGWRGFALPRMQARQPALAASLLLGVLWGLWHLPLEIAIGISPLGYIDFVLSIIGFSVLFTWVYNNTKGSLFLMVLFHAVMDIVVVTIRPTSNTLIVPVLYLILLWFVVTIVVVRTGAARLSRKVVVAPA